MKQMNLLYCCRIKESKINLHIEHWLVGKYPISFTTQECLEEFCEFVGWQFLEHYENRIGLRNYELPYYEFRFKLPRDEILVDTILDVCYGHVGRPAEEVI